MLPNVIIPGAPKAGTTTICEILGKSRQVFVPAMKEPRYFISNEINALSAADPLKKYLLDSSVMSADAYRKLYDVDKKVRIDASVQYLFYHQVVIPRVQEILGDPKVIIVLRDPVERAISNYLFNAKVYEHDIMTEIERETALDRPEINSFLKVYSQGLYAGQVDAYVRGFSAVKVVVFEEFLKDKQRVIDDLCAFLEIDNVDATMNRRLNRTGVPKNAIINKIFFTDSAPKRALHQLLNWIIKRDRLFRIKVVLKSFLLKDNKGAIDNIEGVRGVLRTRYKEDIERLEGTIHKDLSLWKNRGE